jgi:beta-lactamase regulating signal transducer with metallopeptidase domain
MNPLTGLLSQHTLLSVGWTLVHSIWQVALVALILRLCMAACSRSSSGFRYGLSLLALATVLLSAFLTFLYYYRVPLSTNLADTPSSSLPSLTAGVQVRLSDGQVADDQLTGGSWWLKVKDMMVSGLPVMVWFWLIGMWICSIRFWISLSHIHRLRHSQIVAMPDEVTVCIRSLGKKIGLQGKGFVVKKSLIAGVPMVIGIIKPVVLLPAALVANLPPEQLEAILAHELAHIRRADNLVNLFQVLMEILFFYHPLLWWISSVRIEREHCCDDLANRVTGNPRVLARALLNLETSRQAVPAFCSAISNNKKHKLLQRIMRMKTQKPSQRPAGQGLAIAALVAAGVLMFALASSFAPRIIPDAVPNRAFCGPLYLLENAFTSLDDALHQTNVKLKSVFNTKPEAGLLLPPDTNRKAGKTGNMALQFKDSTGMVVLKLDRNGNLIGATVDGKSAPPEVFEEYRNKLQENSHAGSDSLEKAKEMLENAREEMEKAKEQYGEAMLSYLESLLDVDDSNEVKLWELNQGDLARALDLSKLHELPELYELRGDFPDEFHESLREYNEQLLEKDHELLEKYKDARDVLFDHYPRGITVIPDVKYPNLPLLYAEPFRISKRAFRDAMRSAREKMKIEKSIQEGLLNNIEWKKFAEFDKQLREELLRDRLIKRKDRLSVKITSKKMEINGKEQPEYIHRKYLELYKKITGKTPGVENYFMITD